MWYSTLGQINYINAKSYFYKFNDRPINFEEYLQDQNDFKGMRNLKRIKKVYLIKLTFRGFKILVMCGLVGFIRKNNFQKSDCQLLRNVINLLIHRVPDSQSYLRIDKLHNKDTQYYFIIKKCSTCSLR